MGEYRGSIGEYRGSMGAQAQGRSKWESELAALSGSSIASKSMASGLDAAHSAASSVKNKSTYSR